MLNALDILNECSDRLGWKQIETLDTSQQSAQARKLTRLLNRVVQTWCGLQNWPLLRAEGSLVLVADVVGDSDSSEFVTATNGSDTVTIDNVTLDDTYKQRAFQVDGDENVYTITEVPSPTSIKIHRAWISDSITAADEKTFTIAQDRYALPSDFDRPSTSMDAFFDPYKIDPLSPNEFLRARRNYTGIHVDNPKYFTIYGTNPGETVELVHFEPYPDEVKLLNFHYQKKHREIDSDNDVILIEERYGEALISMVMHLATLHYEDDQKTQSVLLDMLREYNTQSSNQELTRQPLVLRPRNQTRIDFRQATLRSGLPYDWGDTFDIYPIRGIR